MCRVGRAVRVDLVVGISVVGGQQDHVIVGNGSVHHLPDQLVDARDGAGHGVVYARVADHVAVGKVQDDHILDLGVDLVDQFLGHLGSTHLRQHVVGRDHKISEEITETDLKGRKDFRKTFTFTIDPSDAKDFDDALSFRPLENGNYEVGVHIADVSYYVKPGSPVDKEARERGTSVYLVDRTVPMLPEKLCNKLCSLRPYEDKLTFSAVFEMTPKAEIKSRWIGRTVINSDHRLDYDQAQAIIEKQTTESELDMAIVTLNKLAGIMRRS